MFRSMNQPISRSLFFKSTLLGCMALTIAPKRASAQTMSSSEGCLSNISCEFFDHHILITDKETGSWAELFGDLSVSDGTAVIKLSTGEVIEATSDSNNNFIIIMF